MPRIRPGKWDVQNSLKNKQITYLILTKRPDKMIVNKKNFLKKYRKKNKKKKEKLVNSGFWRSVNHGVKSKKTKKKKKRHGPRPCERSKKKGKHEGNAESNCKWFPRNDRQMHKGVGRVGNRKMSRDYLNPGIIEIGQSIENSPLSLRRLAVTQIADSLFVLRKEGEKHLPILTFA